MSYIARFPNPAIEKDFWKELYKLPSKAQENILQTIRDLQKNPRPFGHKPFKQLSPPVYVYDYAAQYRFRVGDYRIIYDIDDGNKTVWILSLRKRNEKTYN